MSCSDPDSPDKGESTDVSKMGEVLTKAEPEAEVEDVSSEIPEIASEREDADGAPSSDEQGAPNSDSQINSCDEDSEYDEALAKDQLGPCACDACVKDRKLTESTLEEMRKLQGHWMDLRQQIRMVYRMAMDVKAPTEGYQQFIKEHVQKLCACDPHQLFQRLESQIQEFVIETKVRQLELLNREKDSPTLPYLFISGLLDNYKKLLSAANELEPLLEQLQSEHLSKFNLTWKVLNQHLYQSCVYTDPYVQAKVPGCIGLLSSKSTDAGEGNKKLVIEFLSFDDEMTLVGSLWREAETKIHQYNQEQATIKAKQRMMKEDWEFFKAQRKLIHQKIWNSKGTSSDLKSFEELGDDPNGHGSCPCEECAMSHLLSCGGLVTPPHSPALPPTSEHDGRVEGEGREQSDIVPECECHVCTAPPVTSSVVELESSNNMNINLQGGGFHLYPHIHGTSRVPAIGDDLASVYPHLFNIHSQLLANSKHPELEDQKQLLTEGEPKGGTVLRPSTPPVPPPKRPEVPPPTKPSTPTSPAPAKAPAPAKPHRHSTTQTPAQRLHQSLPDVVPPSCHSHGHNHVHNHLESYTHNHGHNGKKLGCGSDRKPSCHGHEHDDETSPEDSCSDRSSSTQRGESRHCDCCYCEVFGHGVPSVAPVSRNYTEMRERLRQLLTKKKAKCKTGVSASANATSTIPTPSATSAPTTNSSVSAAPVVEEAENPKDPRDLEDLLDFIEGNPSQKCKDEKKAAKKARQKQKKQEEIERKKREEEEAERRRIEEEEAARALLKQQRKEAKKLKKKKKALAALADKTEEHQVPQMVTIKRVMEPHSSEPTVTITLRGATPNEDKVLYTLLNGQVCQLPKDSKTVPKGKQQAAQQQQAQNNVKSKNPPQNSNSSVKIVNGVQGQSNKVTAKTKKVASNSVHQKTGASVSVVKKKVEPVSKPVIAPIPPPPAPLPQTTAPAVPPKLTSPTAIQINNAINRLSSRQPLPNNFNIDSLKLPPGITITKVDPSQVSQQRKPIPQPSKPNPPPTVTAVPPQMSATPNHSNVIVVDTGKLKDLNSVPNKDLSDDGNGKKKKKKKNGNINGNTMNGSNTISEPLKNNMVRLTMNGGPPKRIMTPPLPQNGKVLPPQAAIIKVNGSMVTIRSPALQHALNAKQQEDSQAGKKKKKKKGGGGQGNHDESWNHIDEESVFAPKDIDLESGEMDDAERELEAFKRFCLQSVPPKRKEKVHLNIKDIVLKKKSSAISCS